MLVWYSGSMRASFQRYRLVPDRTWGSISSDSSPTAQPWFSTLLISPVSPGIPLTLAVYVKSMRIVTFPSRNTRGDSLSIRRDCDYPHSRAQVHSNVGYVVTYPLNLAVLLPPPTVNDPKVDNHTLTLYVLSSLQIGSSLNMR